MPDPFRVLIADFLDETSVEDSVLGGLATLETANAADESQLDGRLLAVADAIITYHDISRISDATLAKAGKCRGIVRAGVGFNNVDIVAAGKRGIVVCNVPDYGTEEVADHAIALLLAVARQIHPSDAAIRAGEWHYKTALAAPRLRGKTLGLVGCGRIGTATALRARAFGLEVIFFDNHLPDGLDKALGIRRVRSLDDLLSQSHFVSLHCFLDESTHHLIDAKALAKLQPGGILINTARGPVVDQAALVEALDSGHLLGAGIDVVEREPLDDERLRNHPRVILTPHSAFYSIEGFVELRRKTAEEIRRLLTGEPPRNPVNSEWLTDARARMA